jgi:hypothetical protein
MFVPQQDTRAEIKNNGHEHLPSRAFFTVQPEVFPISLKQIALYLLEQMLRAKRG